LRERGPETLPSVNAQTIEPPRFKLAKTGPNDIFRPDGPGNAAAHRRSPSPYLGLADGFGRSDRRLPRRGNMGCRQLSSFSVGRVLRAKLSCREGRTSNLVEWYAQDEGHGVLRRLRYGSHASADDGNLDSLNQRYRPSLRNIPTERSGLERQAPTQILLSARRRWFVLHLYP